MIEPTITEAHFDAAIHEFIEAGSPLRIIVFLRRLGNLRLLSHGTNETTKNGRIFLLAK